MEIFINFKKKINSGIFFIVIIDYLFYLSAFLVFSLWSGKLAEKYELINIPESFSSQYLLEKLLLEIRGFWSFIVYSLVFIAIAIFIMSLVSKSIIWALTVQAKMTKQYFLKFFLVKIIWNISALALIILSFAIMEQGAAVIFSAAVLTASLYFSCILYPIFAKSLKVSAIKESLKLGFSKIHYMALPCILIALVGVLLSRIYSISSNQYWVVFSSLAMLSYIALARYYISALAYSVKK